MATLTGYLPWIGSGSLDNPYNIGLPLSWQSRAQSVLAGLTCYSPVDGTKASPFIGGLPANFVLSSFSGATRLYSTGSGAICQTQIDQSAIDVVVSLSGYPAVSGDEALLRALCVSEAEEVTLRFEQYLPLLDWRGDVTGAAVSVLDDLLSGDNEAQRLWSYYREVLTAALPTPDGPAELLIVDSDGETIANIERCNEVAEVPDSMSNQIRRANLAYSLIVLNECITSIPEPV